MVPPAHMNSAEFAELEDTEFFETRMRALTIASAWVFISGIIGIGIHFATKGPNFPLVPISGSIAEIGAIAGVLVARKTRSIEAGGRIVAICFAVSGAGLITFSDGLHSALMPMLCGIPGFAALFWNPRGAMWTLFAILSLMAVLAIGELFDLVPHDYFGPFPDLRSAAYTQSVFNAMLMVAGTGFFYVREQDMIKAFIFEKSLAARQAEQARTKFLANVTHELRTPLNGIAGMSMLLKTEALSAQQQNYVETMDASLRKLEGLIDNLLIAATQIDDEPATEIALSVLIDGLAINPHEFSIVTPSEDQVLFLPVDTVSNIITLLLKTARIRHQRFPIHIEFEYVGDGLRMRIEDQGDTLSKSQFHALLESFERREDNKLGMDSNAQLGLGFAHELTAQIGAEIDYVNGKQYPPHFVLTLSS